jgi:hypothetical protein
MMVKLSTKIVQVLCEKGLLERYICDKAALRSEVINTIDAVVDLHVQERMETDDERSVRVTEFLDDADAGLTLLSEERIAKGLPMPKVRDDDGGYELQVISFDNRWAKMRILENDEIIFVPPKDLHHYIIIDDE